MNMIDEYKNKKILITGATGLIGCHLTKELLKLGCKVAAMGRSIDKLKTVFADESSNDDLCFIEGNLADANLIDKSDFLPWKVDYIFHAASPISGAEIRLKPVDTISANIDGIRNCLELLRRQGSGRLIVFSSATAYGNQFTEDVIYKEEETDKADALHTANTPYSESKRMTEVLARAYSAQYMVDSVIVRIGYVYGYSNPRPATAFYEFIGKAINGDDIVLNNSGMGRRDNIHVDDVVSGLLIVAAKGETGEAYNISSCGDLGNYSAIDEMALMIADAAGAISGISVKAHIKPMTGDRNPGMRLDNSKLKQMGWEVKVSLEEGIKNTVLSYLSGAEINR